MADVEKKLPGVTLWLTGCAERASALSPDVVLFSMQVEGRADSQAIFEKIKGKFNDGFTVHTVEDLKGQMIKVLKEDNREYAQQVRELEIQLMNERKANAMLKEQMQRERDTLNFFRSKV